jgi:hypothetical protein
VLHAVAVDRDESELTGDVETRAKAEDQDGREAEGDFYG